MCWGSIRHLLAKRAILYAHMVASGRLPQVLDGVVAGRTVHVWPLYPYG
jgi:hypothetical protein